MPESPLVSIIVPTRNRREVLRRCLDALVKQTYHPYEVIVVDDCSTDDTPRYLAEFADAHADMGFKRLRNETHLGANPSRNRGIPQSKGAYLAFLDNDCIARPDWLERLLAGFVSDRVAAVTGRVDDPEPTNLYELTFKGTHRVYGRTRATRLVAGNMAIRRDLLLEHMFDEDRATPHPDESVSGRGDEEGLFLRLRAAGYEQRVVPDAVVRHEHFYSRRTLFRQAYRGGQAAARLGYKYHLPPRVELLPLLVAYLSIPPALVLPAGWWITVLGAGLFLGAILYNDLCRKRKTPLETLVTFPLLLGYYHVRFAGYVVQYLRLWLGYDRIRRVRLT